LELEFEKLELKFHLLDNLELKFEKLELIDKLELRVKSKVYLEYYVKEFLVWADHRNLEMEVETEVILGEFPSWVG
jgi:hypothetical protein